MKFLLTAFLAIRNIIGTNQLEEASCINSLEDSSELKNSYKDLVASIMNYICHKDECIESKDKILLKINDRLKMKNLSSYEISAYNSLINNIKNDVEKFSPDVFNYILIDYYMDRSNIDDESIENKEILENILRSRKDIQVLVLDFKSMLQTDIFNLLNAMSKNITELIIINPSSSNIFKLFNKYKESIKQEFSLCFNLLNYNSELYEEILYLLGNFNITKFTVMNYELDLLAPISFFDSLKNIKNLKDLLITDSFLLEKDINSIINIINSKEMVLKRLVLSNLRVSETLLSKLFDEIAVSTNLESFVFMSKIKTIKNISKVLSNNNISLLKIASDDINSSNIKYIIEEIKNNKNLTYFELNSNELNLKDFTLVLEAILNNANFKEIMVIFTGKEDLYKHSEKIARKDFKELEQKIIEKSFEIAYNWVYEFDEEDLKRLLD